MKLQLIEWIDSFSLTDRWMTPEALESEYKPEMVCMTIGFVVLEDEHFVVVAQSYSTKPDGSVEEWGHIWAIPQVAILNRDVVDLRNGLADTATDHGGVLRRKFGPGPVEGLQDAQTPDEKPVRQSLGRDVLVSLLTDEGSETGGPDAGTLRSGDEEPQVPGRSPT